MTSKVEIIDRQADRIRFLLDLIARSGRYDILMSFFEYVAAHPYVDGEQWDFGLDENGEMTLLPDQSIVLFDQDEEVADE